MAILISDAVAKPIQTYPDIDTNQWINVTPVYFPASSGGNHLAVGWNTMTYDRVNKQVILFDRWYDSVRKDTVYANAVMAFDISKNEIFLLKRNNWKKSLLENGGYRTVEILPENHIDPTPVDRHSYGCFSYVPDNHSVYLVYGANQTGPDQPPDTWRFHIGEKKWYKIDSVLKPPHGVNKEFENSTVYETKTHNIVYSMHGKETWLLDVHTEQWQKADPSREPGSRMRYSMGYDEKRRLVMLFGGYTGWNPKTAKKDLWVYDASQNSWTQKTNAPEGSDNKTAMAYSSVHDVFLVQIEDSSYVYSPAADSWTLLGKTEGVVPAHKTLVYDTKNDLFVMMGKQGSSTPVWWVMRYEKSDTRNH